MNSKVLVSACLLGARVRYDGGGATSFHDVLVRWQDEGRVVTVCPEVAGGLPIPRPPAEIEHGEGRDVLAGRAFVRTRDEDVSGAFIAGAEHALELAQKHDIQVAVLKARSPSCGSLAIYDGTRTRTLRDGMGVAAALLDAHGIRVFDEERFEEADAFLQELDARSAPGQ